MAKARKKPTEAAKVRDLQERLRQANKRKDDLHEMLGALRAQVNIANEKLVQEQERAHNLEVKVVEAEAEATANIEEVQRDLAENREIARYNDGLADGRKEAMEILEGLVTNAARNLKPLVGANLSELLAPLVPNADNVIMGIASIMHAMTISHGSGTSGGGKSGKGPAKGEDPDDQVGD